MQTMARKRRVRDIYGNWVMENEDTRYNMPDAGESSAEAGQNEREIHLDWKDYVALSLASLETFLLPVVVFMVVILVLAVIITHA